MTAGAFLFGKAYRQVMNIICQLNPGANTIAYCLLPLA